MSARYRNHLWCAAIFGWGLAAIAVWCWTTTYEFTVSDSASSSAPQHWPASSPLALSETRPTLLLFLHPRCPCSRASVHELIRVIDHLPSTEQPDLRIIATVPPDASPAWRESDTVRNASKLPHSSVVWDTGGAISRAFGATSSGTVQLYQPDGDLKFAGGVTASRGHQGDNFGSDALTRLLAHASTESEKSTPIFGCRLYIGDPIEAAASVCDDTGCNETSGACVGDLAKDSP